MTPPADSIFHSLVPSWSGPPRATVPRLIAPPEELPAPEAPKARPLHADLDEEREGELPHPTSLPKRSHAGRVKRSKRVVSSM